MQAANRPGELSRIRRRRDFRPSLQSLEKRDVPAIDLANIAGGTGLPGPYGIVQEGQLPNAGLGWSSALTQDTNGDAFQDMILGAPTVSVNPLGFPSIGNGINGRAYLVFGSSQVSGPINWLTLTPQQRAGTITNLGNAAQTNPFNGQPGLPFAGITFITSNNTASALGASVADAGDLNGDGFEDFLIGAPGANDVLMTTPNTGRAYLVYGSQALFTRANKTVDLDNPSANTDLNIITFVGGGIGSLNGRIGRSVAGIGDFITDGRPDIAIGAPNASPAGLANQGAIYVVSGNFLSTPRTATVLVDQIGQPNGVPGFLITGALSGDRAGFSVAGAGDTTGRTTSARQPITDLLIGAPATTTQELPNGPGRAYLLYGDLPQNLQNYTVVTNGVTNIRLSTLNQTTTPIGAPGAVFVGAAVGDGTGYSVASAGDFNADGKTDIQIGSPGFDGTGGLNSGRANMIYGQGTTNNVPNLTGTFQLSTLPATVPNVEFDGASPGAHAGFSVTPTGRINNDTINEIAIGSPGVNNNSGQAYIIPGQDGLFGVQSLAAAEQLPIQGLIISLSALPNQTPGSAALLGASVAGNVNVNGTNTMDADTLGDLIVGAPALSPTGANVAGTGFGLEGAFLPVPTPVSTAITTTIGVDQPFAPFNISATTPTTISIYVFSNATVTPPFVPPTQLNPASIVVNGVAFPASSVQILTDPVDENNDGLKDAIVVLTPRSALNLQPGLRTIDFTARVLPTGPNANRRVTGSAQVTVSGGTSGGGGLGSLPQSFFGFSNPNAAVPPFGSRLLPSVSVVYKYNWTPLPTNVAYRQFLPKRLTNPAVHPLQKRPDGSSLKKYTQYKTSTLGQYVFTRGKYAPNRGVIDARHPQGKRR